MYVLIIILAGPFAGVGYDIAFTNDKLCEQAKVKVLKQMKFAKDAMCLKVK